MLFRTFLSKLNTIDAFYKHIFMAQQTYLWLKQKYLVATVASQEAPSASPADVHGEKWTTVEYSQTCSKDHLYVKTTCL